MSAKYEMLGELGRGAMGVVYRAKQVGLDREVALKVLPAEMRDSDMLRRFRREVKVACGLSHPHIVHIYDGGELDGRPFYAMEIVRGQELAQVIAHGPSPFADVLRWAEQGADALAYFHTSGLSHRDLKPGNLMINEARDLILMDFGLAKDPAGTLLTEAGAVVGTPRYIAPEGYRGGETGTPSDVWAFMLCLHEAVIGAQWDRSKTVTELAQRVMQGPPPTLAGRPEVPAWFVEIEARALATDPAERLTAPQLRDALKRRGRGMIAGARKTSKSTPLPITDGSGRGSSGVPTARPGGRGAVLGLAAGVFVLGLAGAFYVSRRPPVPASASPAPAPLTLTATFPAHRRVRFACTGAPPAGAELVVRGRGQTWRTPAAQPELTLPQRLDAAVTLEHEGNALAGPLAFQTPAIEPIARLHVQPSDLEALVDFELERPVAITMNVYRTDGARAAHTELPPGTRTVTHWFTGLRPDTDYRLEILTPSGWGGASGFGFRTESSKQSTGVQAAIKLIRSSPELVEYCLSVANKVPDRRLGPPLLAWLRSGHPSVNAQLKKVAWVAERTRDRELAGELGLHVMDTEEESVARYVLAALGQTRHPEAPRIARAFLGRWDESDSFVNCIKCLAAVPSPDALKAVEPHLKRYRDVTRAAPWMVRVDRVAAHALFRGMLAGTDHGPESLVKMGCTGLIHIRDDADVPLLETLLAPGEAARFGRGMALGTLVALGSPAARAAVERAYRAQPGDLECLWAVGQLKLDVLAPQVLETFSAAKGRLKRDAACVLGLLGRADAAPALIEALKDPAAEVRDAAGWALGRLHATGAALRLREAAMTQGAGDGPIFGLGLLADPEAAAALGKLAEDVLFAEDKSRVALVDWAKRRTAGEKPGRPGDVPLFAIAAYDRADMRFEPGDVVRAWVTGTWRWGGGKDEAAARTQKIAGVLAAARVVVGGQVLNIENRPESYLIEHGGDALLTPWDFPPVHFGGLPMDEPHGFAVVHLELQR